MNSHNELAQHWSILAIMLSLLISFNVLSHLSVVALAINLSIDQRVFIRTILYILAIILFPLVNLLRYILLRLNQTIPGEMPAARRYLITITLTQVLMEVIGSFGFVMFLLGDGYNTLYIFTLLGALGIFLHRPKQGEYQQISQALDNEPL